MNSIKYRISQMAIEDLEDIWLFTFKTWSKEQADRYYNLLIGEIEFVSENMMIGKAVELSGKNYRVTQVKSHLIYYKKDENDLIEIVRILHQRMNVKLRLK